MTFSILICALNEEKNIGLLLENILEQVYDGEWILDNIVVVSDGSTDKTNEIVENFSKDNKKIVLIKNKERKGKAISFNEGKKNIFSDYLMSLDADVFLDKDVFSKVLQKIKSDCPDMATVHAKPKLDTSFNFSSFASMGTYYLMQEIIKNNRRSIYGARGVFVALSKEFYNKLELLDAPGTDMFMYLYCASGNYKYQYISSTTVYFYPPKSFYDYRKQNHRASVAKDFYERIFNSNYTCQINFFDRLKIFIKSFIKHPVYIIVWFCFYFFSFVTMHFFKKEVPISSKWSVACSTKAKYHL